MSDKLSLDKLRICLDELRRDNPRLVFFLEGDSIFLKRRHLRTPVPVYELRDGRVHTVYQEPQALEKIRPAELPARE